MRTLVMAGLLAAGVPALAQAAAPTLIAGPYSNVLMIGRDPASGLISGYFSMTYAGPPAMSCIFYIKGTPVGAKATVETYDVDDPQGDMIVGTLTVTSNHTLTLSLPSDHGGCGNVQSFTDSPAPDFDLDTPMPWTSVRVVKAKKAYFYASAGAATHERAYLVNGDGLGVRASQKGWLQVDYTAGDKPMSGWVREEDLYPGP
jgi:hypothetical protein